MEPRIDPITKIKFFPKRINQRFEKKENRILYWNNKANQIRHRKSSIDKPLNRNYLILLKLLEGKKEAQFHKQYLLGMGYSFGVYTHIEEHNGNTTFAIYDFVVFTDDSDNIKFIKHGK